MTANFRNYDLYYKFIHTYSPFGFRTIDFDSPLMKELDELMEKNNQFIVAGDFLKMKIEYASSRSIQFIGIKPEDLDPFRFIDATHPDDVQRHYLCRAKMSNIAKELYLSEKGITLLSTNLRLRNPAGEYIQTLFQEYLYFVSIPYKSVFILQIHTNIDWWKPAKNGFHHYVGKDLKLHRYPDNDLLNIGIPFSLREFEIIKLIATGMNSEQIAEKLFISINTVSTHRKNILAKSGKKSISDLIYYLMEWGVL
jgi:DNA-binding CsgD family transcriptional regulator